MKLSINQINALNDARSMLITFRKIATEHKKLNTYEPEEIELVYETLINQFNLK